MTTNLRVVAEAGLPASSAISLEVKYLDQLYQKSPISFANNVHLMKLKVNNPVLLLLGSDDKRVTMDQGLQFYRNLKARNCDVKVMIYQDGHTLESSEIQTSMSMEILNFLKRITAKSKTQ
ncbi:Acylamino-acid-releasing enzyme [Thelohanellus kitauei]|uniref:Acylamino-acid-releasing enzyme n=1 Tax=Thelohanellus kitauei TaxID=669202 RepID=A0A0C2MUD8_THEKT|nr:Acylamino-acid-releasing enzyme [Thelohanellus kitauei]